MQTINITKFKHYLEKNIVGIDIINYNTKKNITTINIIANNRYFGGPNSVKRLIRYYTQKSLNNYTIFIKDEPIIHYTKKPKRKYNNSYTTIIKFNEESTQFNEELINNLTYLKILIMQNEVIK